jgi:hypothetical protein
MLGRIHYSPTLSVAADGLRLHRINNPPSLIRELSDEAEDGLYEDGAVEGRVQFVAGSFDGGVDDRLAVDRIDGRDLVGEEIDLPGLFGEEGVEVLLAPEFLAVVEGPVVEDVFGHDVLFCVSLKGLLFREASPVGKSQFFSK